MVAPDCISLHPQYPATSSTTAAQKKIIPYVSIHSKETQKYNCQSMSLKKPLPCKLLSKYTTMTKLFCITLIGAILMQLVAFENFFFNKLTVESRIFKFKLSNLRPKHRRKFVIKMKTRIQVTTP